MTERDRPVQLDDIVITQEMIEAGVSVLEAHMPDYDAPLSFRGVAEEVFREMLRSYKPANL